MMKKLMIILVVAMVLVLASCKKPAPEYTVKLLPGIDSIYVNEQWVDAGCVLEVEDKVYTMERENNPDTSKVDEFVVRYSYVFENYYEVTCLRVVKVIQNEFPTVLLVPGIDTVFVNTEHIDMGITAEDDINETLHIEVISDVDTSIPGTYSIVYKVTDMDRHQTVITRIVTVIE